MLKWTILSLIVIVLDQITKHMASANLMMFDPVAIMPMLNFTLMHNEGAAFSFLSDAGGWQRWFFSILAFVVSIILIVWIKKLKPEERALAISLALILGGAIGNLIDRLRFGYVVDFIDVYYNDMHWPAFNIADSAISVGAVLMIILSFRSTDEEKQARAKDKKTK